MLSPSSRLSSTDRAAIGLTSAWLGHRSRSESGTRGSENERGRAHVCQHVFGPELGWDGELRWRTDGQMSSLRVDLLSDTLQTEEQTSTSASGEEAGYIEGYLPRVHDSSVTSVDWVRGT